MDKDKKERIEGAAVTGVGAGVGSVGGATAGVLELASQGSVTNLSAGLAIAGGAVVGGLAFFYGYKLFRRLTKSNS